MLALFDEKQASLDSDKRAAWLRICRNLDRSVYSEGVAKIGHNGVRRILVCADAWGVKQDDDAEFRIFVKEYYSPDFNVVKIRYDVEDVYVTLAIREPVLS